MTAFLKVASVQTSLKAPKHKMSSSLLVKRNSFKLKTEKTDTTTTTKKKHGNNENTFPGRKGCKQMKNQGGNKN